MHKLSVPTLSNIPSLSGSSGSGSIPPSGLCTPSDDDRRPTATRDFFSKSLTASMEDLFATPRPKYGLPEPIDDEDMDVTAGSMLEEKYSDHARVHLKGPHRSAAQDGFDEGPLEISSGHSLASLDIPVPAAPIVSAEMWTAKRLLCVATKVLFFLPWCVAVGGAIMLSPRHLHLVAFNTGYVSYERGPHRFGYWAQCAHQHVVIFLAFLAVGVWWNLRYGTWVVAGMLACAAYAWHDYKVDLTVPLGEDDRQSLYLALTKVYLQDDFIMHVPTKRVSAS
ncbi:hypothetical protein DAEQUDRAFT_728641 [Daedalea quercina L-15889]|uniref:Uncharacterized protein n=1 Tax=Daedalea quercina L-15889 TaxID=1314783 RepID=A0A165P7K7_9APHY|nr:hypothetical protein DAEQUDRAFT_728641 [Daedalea quercina L-15889]